MIRDYKVFRLSQKEAETPETLAQLDEVKQFKILKLILFDNDFLQNLSLIAVAGSSFSLSILFSLPMKVKIYEIISEFVASFFK